MSVGHVLAGRYTVGEVIGRGGMAEVRVGHDTRTGRQVAIKVIHSTKAEDPLVRSSLRREARMLRRVRHHAIVALVDAGHEDGGDAPYIVMEHVDGRSLRDLLRAGDLTPETSVRYLLGVLVALEASHRAGVVHRDIKPANVMVTSAGTVKLVDFGIARASGDQTATVTDVQGFLGTPVYFSPEQARSRTTDARSDLYSAGCLLFELLTGWPPFTGDDPLLLAYQHVYEPAPQADTGVPAVDAVIAKALAKDPDDRFQSAGAFQLALLCATGLPTLISFEGGRCSPHGAPRAHRPHQRGTTSWDPSPSETRTAQSPSTPRR